MKKNILSLCFIFICTGIFAQGFSDSNTTITFGLMGGYDLAVLQVKSPNRQYVQTDFVTPFSLGLSADFKFNDYFSLRPAIFYAGKGGTTNALFSVDKNGREIASYDVANEHTLHYLEIPVQAIGHLPVGDDANIFLGAGLYYAYALNGKNKQVLGTSEAITHKLSFGSNGDFSPSDYGITSVLGFQSEAGWSVSGNLEFGLPNILRNNYTGFDPTKMSTITFYVTVGQSF